MTGLDIDTISAKEVPELFILTEAGPGKGFGHLSRCLSLAQAWCERHSASTLALVVDGVVPADPALSEFKVFQTPWTQNPEALLPLFSTQPFLILDSYHLSLPVYHWLSSRSKGVLYFDDLREQTYPQASILNSALFAERQPYPQAPQTLLGSQYVPLRRAFWDLNPQALKSGRLERLMISFGGDDSLGLTRQLMPKLQSYGGLELDIVVGPYFQDLALLTELTGPLTRLHVSPDAQTMAQLMSEADLAICAGGQTLYELACAGTPALAVQVADNQRANLAAWAEVGSIRQIQSCHSPNWMEDIFLQLSQSDENWRSQASQAGRHYVDGQGARRVIEWVSNWLQKHTLRPV